ncbi:MAG: hypothetical protein ACI8ZB_001893 [Desulforhopalus sp.]|jgi:hypothetical protein
MKPAVIDHEAFASNHIHLLLLDNGGNNVIPVSIKLVPGRTAQE